MNANESSSSASVNESMRIMTLHQIMKEQIKESLSFDNSQHFRSIDSLYRIIEENESGPRTHKETDVFLNIASRNMTYFGSPVQAIFMRDETKTVWNHELKKRNDRDQNKLKNFKLSNENVAHEMRAPLGAIIVIIGILIVILKS